MNFKKSISFVLTMCMVFSLFATFVLPVAAEGTTYTMIDTVEDLKAGTYYMAAYIEKDGYDPYQLFNGIGSGKGYTTGYTYADGVLATTATQYLAEAVEVAAVEGKENTYTIYLEGKGYVTCTDGSANHKLNFSDTACEWEAYANANGGINFKTTVGSNVAHMGTNVTSTSQFIRQYKDSSAANSLSYGLVFFAEDVEEEVPPVTSKVVENWNHADWNTGINTFDAAYIYTDAAVYAETDMLWWNHAAFAPTETEGMYEVTEVALNGSDAAKESSLTIPEGGFVWVGWSGAAAESSGKYAFDFIARLTDGDKVTFYGLDIANCTTTADAYAEKYVEPVDPNAPVSIALGKKCIYPTAGLYYHWDAKWECSKYVETALTDGVKEAGYYGVGETSGWGGGSPNPLEIVIDLEKLYDVDSFAYTLIGGGRDGIAFPASAVISVSKDNADYTVVEGTLDTGKESSSDCYDRTYTVSLDSAVTARYVKFSFTKTGNFLFVNELEVFGEESASTEKVPVNVAFDKDYTISGNGKPYGNYTASLTDGAAQEKLSYDGNWFTFYHNTGESAAPNVNAPDKVGYVIIDLGGLYDLSSVKAHCYDAKGSSGINGPAALTVYVSEDGETWSDAIAVEIPALEAASDYWTETAVSGKAQYVKFEAKLNGTFAFINEIEVWGTEAEVEEDDESFKETHTLIDGVNAGTIQQLGEANEGKPTSPFWYLVEDGVDTITVSVVIDNATVVEGLTPVIRYWIDADLSSPKERTTLIDLMVENGEVKVARVDNGMEAAILEVEYATKGNDCAFVIVLDKATLGIDGQYGLNTQVDYDSNASVAEAGNIRTMHSSKWDATDDKNCAPWSTTEFYEVFGDADTFKNDYTYVDGETVGTTQSRGEGWESLLVPDFWYKVTDTEDMVFVYVMVDNRNVLPGILNAEKPTQLDSGTSLRLWIDADLSDTARTTLVDVAYIDGSAKAYRVDNDFAAAVSTDFAVDGNDYGFCVVLDKAALGIDGEYGMMVTLSETGYNTMHNVKWDVYDVANCAPWSTTKDYIVYGTSEEPEVEYNEVVVDVNANEILTDGRTGFVGGWAVVGDSNVVLIKNGKCTTNPMKVVVNYALGETKTIDALVLDFYHCAAVMIGYPEGQVLVEYSVDGVEYTEIGLFDLEAAMLSTTTDGTVSSTLAFDAVDAAYVRATFVVGSNKDVLGNSPADGKVFWEFAALAEVAVSEVPAPSYNEGWNAEFDENELTFLKGDISMFGDGNWGEDAVAFGNEAVILVQNLVCKNPELYPVFSLVYNAGEAIDLNNIKVGLYVETNSMIGFPSKVANVYISADGISWQPIDSTNNIEDSVFVQHGNSENSLGTSLVEIVLAETVNAQYVKVEFTYTDSPFNDPNGDYKPVYEFIAFTEAEVRLVENVVVEEDYVELLPTEEDEITGGEVTVNADGSVTVTIGESGKVEIYFDLVDAKFYPVTGAYAIYDYATVGNVTKVETLAQYTRADKGENTAQLYLSGMNNSASYYVENGEGWGVWSLTNYITGGKLFADGVHEIKSMTYTIEGEAGASVVFYTFGIYDSADAVKGLGSVRPAEITEVDGGELPALNPRFGGNLLIPAFTAMKYTVAFENGAFFSLWDDALTVLVNGEAIEGEAELKAGDVVTIINASAEDYTAYPMVVPTILGTMDNPYVLDELGTITAVVDGDHTAGVFYTYIAPGFGTLTITMPEGDWTYFVNNLTSGVYGDAHWSDDEEVVSSVTINVSAGDEIQIMVSTYDPNNMWEAPAGEVTFTASFTETVKVPDGYASADALVDGYTGAGEIFGYEGNQSVLVAFNYLVANAEYAFTVEFDEVTIDGITLYGLDYANGCVVNPAAVAFVVNGVTYEATITANPNGIARMTVEFEEEITTDAVTVVVTADGNANFFNMFTEIKVSEVVEEVITSNVVTDFNLADWTDGKFGADAAVIFTDADVYASANQLWWFHASFAPTSIEGVYEVVATRGPSQDAFLTIPEGGFVWIAHDTAAADTAGKFAVGMISTLKAGDRVVFTGVDFANATTEADATAVKVEAPESVDIKVSHNNLYNWGTFESMIISQPGKTVTEVIGQTPYWWIMYVVEEVDGVYVATEFYKNCDEINTTVCPENGFLFYVYSSNSNWADADYGKLLGCYFILGDIDLSSKFAIDTQVGNEPYIMKVVSGFKTGDVNMNGKVDATDYAMARKAFLGKVELTDAQLKLLDVNGNGKIDANDYMLIKRHVLGTYTIPAWADAE